MTDRPWAQYEGSQCRPAIAERDAVRAEMEREFREREEAEEVETVAYVTPTDPSPGPCCCVAGGPMEVRQLSGSKLLWVRCQACCRGTGGYYTVAEAVAAWESRVGR